MTYTFKLARRLAVSRDLAMLVAAIVLLGSCNAESTAPYNPNTSSPVAVRVVPQTVTVETNQTIRFRGEGASSAGQLVAAPVAWEADGGFIRSDGTFSSAAVGSFKVVGGHRWQADGQGDKRNSRNGHDGRRSYRSNDWMRSDTSMVFVVPPRPDLKRLVVSPKTVTLPSGALQTFAATGHLRDGDEVTVAVRWDAKGGAVDPSGAFTAGQVPGSYQVIATNRPGTVADTATVIVAGSSHDPITPTPDEGPAPLPEPTLPQLSRLVLTPANVSLIARESKKFSAYGRNTTGDSVTVSVTFSATGGIVNADGLYTAGQSAGTYRVVATAHGLSDTSFVTLSPQPLPFPPPSGPPPPLGAGIPFGPFAPWEGTSLRANTEAFGVSLAAVSPSHIVGRINAARAKGVKLFLAMAGGHKPYLTNGAFDLSKWTRTMDEYNTAPIRQAIAAGVADGTILGNSVMDEPHVHGLGDGNTWGPKGTMTKARVDQLCAYVKNIFPTLPVGVVHQHGVFEPSKSYRVCEFFIDQYSSRSGDVRQFRDEGLAMARRDGIAVAFSMNILGGGAMSRRDGSWSCPIPLTGGRGPYDPLCRMTADQVREWGITLGSAGCAMLMWTYDAAFMAKPENQRAFRDVATALAKVPAKPCRKQ